jgi:subtilisin family serine protease
MKAVLLATLCILAVLTSINQVLPQETRPEMVFVQGEEKYPARVEQGRIAVILAEKVASDEGSRRVTMESLNAAPIAGLPDNIVSVTVEGTNEAKALTEMARGLRAARSSEIAASGVIAFLGTSDSPIVITDQIVVQIESDARIVEDIAAKFNATVVATNPFDKNQFVIELPPDSKEATLDASNAINAIPGIRFAHPNFYQAVELRQAPFATNDLLFASQWHLDNTGQNGGTPDADIDADLAWSFTRGTGSIVIAVLDNGFDIGHPDLQPNLLINSDDGTDSDGNGFLGDVNGWNFAGCAHAATPCGNADVTPGIGEDHGTMVAGAAAARGNNMIGVSGVCPQCRFLPIKISGTNNYAKGLAIGYAAARGADIISNSWGYQPGLAIPLAV